MSPVAMGMAVPVCGAYVAVGREVGFPRLDCPSGRAPMMFWSGYRRHVRVAGRCQKVFVPELRAGAAG